MRVGQLVREQEVEVRARERIEQELRGRRLIQHNFLPKKLPELTGWADRGACTGRRGRSAATSTTSSICRMARSGIVIGDVTDKGVPAAMVMATTRSILRASAQRLVSPGEVLERVERTAVPGHPAEDVRDLPVRRFSTPRPGGCATRTPATICPYVRTATGVERAAGARACRSA